MTSIRYSLLLATCSLFVVQTDIYSSAPELSSNSPLTNRQTPVCPNQPGGPQYKKPTAHPGAPTQATSGPRPPKADDQKENGRIENAGTVVQEILDIPDDVPQDLLDKARCVIVFPSVLKAALIVGGSYGRGVMTCRTHKDYTGPWGAPTMMVLEGGSFGLQIGGQATDFVILVMNNRGADSVLQSKVKLGGDASIAAGPKGRDASTDVTMRAEMLSYSRARGVFAGVSLEGSTLRPDNDANKRIYGEEVSAEDIITESRLQALAAAHLLLSRLQKASPRRKE